jgi:hypothetical protein
MRLRLLRSWPAAVAALWVGLPAPAAHAQTRWSLGPRIGENLATARYEDRNGALNHFRTTWVPRLETGLVASVGRPHLALQAGVLYAQKGFVLEGGNQQANGTAVGVAHFRAAYALNYLTVPLQLVYSPQRDGQGFQAFGGGYVGRLLGGRVRYENFQGVVGGTGTFYQAELPVRAGDHYRADGNFYAKRFDAGLQAGVGYRHAGGVLQLAYSVGLTNLGVDYPMNPDPYGPHYANRMLHASLTYLFHWPPSLKQDPGY